MRVPELAHADDIPSPSLVIVRERVEENLRTMIAMANGPHRLRPHVKTHKMEALVKRQVQLGIRAFKCATIAEAEMTAAAGAAEVLLALQPVGPNAVRFIELVAKFPDVRFSTVADDPAVVLDLARRVGNTRPLELLVDLDVGQHRTGVEVGPGAEALVRLIEETPGVVFGGLHAYDGHLHDSDPAARKEACTAAFGPVASFRTALESAGIRVPRVVAGGTPTFPFHAANPTVECSPGTCVFWDAGYGTKLRDLPFVPAAFLLTRVVSRPTPRRICLDLGHKAVASEMAPPRVVFPALPESVPVAHNEEHLVLETAEPSALKVGDWLLGIPWHVCPTVALHAEAWVVDDGRVGERWPVTARARRLTI